ncbi:MAG: YjgP/YjgQ family permease [Bacteroidetes bacterium]|nr:MAG: YjgP/YjgQ family permease [Bacteroidota bacterium]TAE66858.1 MAG: YjgP/YjgQ family permease [Bacteroidota bacterium]TAF93369.1 MAG: YjgP/YjgQ family permease [Bacteroidota bacterium]
MKIIDRYILKNFLVTFFFSIFLFAVIAVVIDISEKTEDFVRAKLDFTDIIMQYYIGFVPHILALLFPLFVFIAVIYFTSKLAGRTEVVAILASGVSLRRFLVPYWVGGCLLALTLWFANLQIVPRANEIRTHFETVYVNRNSTYNPLMAKNNNIYFRTDSFSYAGIQYYDTLYKSGGPYFVNTIKGNQVVYNLRAESIRWDTIHKKWQLVNLVERFVDSMGERMQLQPERLVKTSFTPFDLKRDDYTKDKLTSQELAKFIRMQEIRGVEGLNTLKVEKHRRDATAFSVLVLTLIGAIIASRKVRGGSGGHLAMGFIMAALFILMDKFSTVFSTKGDFPPMLAAWLPNLLFSFVALYLYKKAPK